MLRGMIKFRGTDSMTMLFQKRMKIQTIQEINDLYVRN